MEYREADTPLFMADGIPVINYDIIDRERAVIVAFDFKCLNGPPQTLGASVEASMNQSGALKALMEKGWIDEDMRASMPLNQSAILSNLGHGIYRYTFTLTMKDGTECKIWN